MWSRFTRPVLRWLVRLASGSSDLLVAGALLLLLHEGLDRGSSLAESDWSTWVVFNISIVAVLRGRSLGLGPHPSLKVRGGGGLDRILLAGAAPWWVWFAAEAVGGSESALRILVALSIGGLVVLMRRRGRLRTAWTPNVPAAVLLALLGVALLGALLFHAGQEEVGSLAALAAACFFAVSLVLGDTRSLSQRWASFEGRPGRSIPRHEVVILATGVLLPAAGLEAVRELMRWPAINQQAGQLPGDEFVWASLATLYVLTWAGSTWKRPTPTGLACLLREMEPAGGLESRHDGEAPALDFSEAPRGALAVEPLAVKRKPRVHPWFVSVDSGRAVSAEHTSLPLWGTREASLGHALGDARCAEDGIPGFLPLPQWDEVVIEPQAQETRETLAESRAGVRRQVILRPFRRPLLPPLSVLPPTFAWESTGAHQLYQLNTGRTLRLAAGDLLVLSSAGIVRCFEFEPGCAFDLNGVRHAPQPEDYLGSGP